MDEAGVDKVLLSFGAGFRTFGVQGSIGRNDGPKVRNQV